MLRVKNKKQVYLVGLNACCGSFLFGYQLVNISSLQNLFANVNNLTLQQTEIYISIITAAVPFGAIIGSLLLKTLMLKMRARFLMIILDILSVLSIIIQCISLTFTPLFIGRLIMGVIVGLNSGLVPQYIYAVTPRQLSGSVGCLHQMLITVGIAFGYGLGVLLDPDAIQNGFDWRFFLAFPVFTCIIRAVNLLFFLPYQIPTEKLEAKDIRRLERYYYTIYENYSRGGRNCPDSPIRRPQSLTGNNNSSSLSDSRRSIGSNDSNQDAYSSSDRIPCPNYDSRMNLVICVVLAFSNQLCGINAILLYAKQMFLQITDDDQSLSQMLVLLLGIVQIITSFTGGLMMDRSNKKLFLIAGESLMVLCLLSIYKLQKYEIMVVLLIFCHTIAYSFSVGPLLMYYSAKMLRNTGYVVMSNWIATFLIALTAEFMMNNLGIGNMCFTYAVLLIVCVGFLFKGIPRNVDGETEVKSSGSQLKTPLNLTRRTTSLKEIPASVNEGIQLSTSDGGSIRMQREDLFSSDRIGNK